MRNLNHKCEEVNGVMVNNLITKIIKQLIKTSTRHQFMTVN